MSAPPGRRQGQDADPFADFRSSGTGTGTQTDERPTLRPVSRDDGRPHSHTGPVADPAEPYRSELEQRPMTRREAREAQARRDAGGRDTGSDNGGGGATVTALPTRLGTTDPGLRVVRDGNDTDRNGRVSGPPPGAGGTGPVPPVASPPSWFGEYRTGEQSVARQIPVRAPQPPVDPAPDHTAYTGTDYRAGSATDYATGYPAPDHVDGYGVDDDVLADHGVAYDDTGHAHGGYPDLFHPGVQSTQYQPDQYQPDQYQPDEFHPDQQYVDEQYPDEQYPDEQYPDHYDDGYAGDLSRAERKAVEREGKRRKARGPRTVLVLIAILGAGGVGCYFAWAGLQPTIQKVRDQMAPPADFAGPGTGQVQIRIDEGETGRQIGQKLFDAGVVASVEAFVDAAKANPRWTSVSYGDYQLRQQLPAADAVAALLDPTNIVKNTINVPPGLRTDEILQIVADKTGVPYDQMVATALALPLPEGAALPPGTEPAPTAIGDWEGWFYGDSYDLGLNPTPESILSLMRDKTVSVLDELSVAPADRRTVLTKASIITKEALFDAEYGQVAQVIDNRLTLGVPLKNGKDGPPLLQMDSTTNYATGIFNPQTTEEQRASTSPFNTYLAEGLPPGPIATPSRGAIEAVLSPTPGPWRFFVTVNLCTGETAFAETAAEHAVNRKAYQDWLAANPKGPNGKYPCGG